MENICENCGAKLKEGAKFCQECGSAVTASAEDDELNFCPNCGKKLTSGEEFCNECGININNPEPKSFIENNKIPLLIIGVVGIIVLTLLIAVSIPHTSESYDYDVGTQTVEVDNIDFKIPGDYVLIPSSIDYDYENFVSSYSHTYTNGDENISIGTVSSTMSGLSAQENVDSLGGVPKTMYGYDGYYNELSDGYAFIFAINNKVCIISASSPYVLDEIEVLG